MSNLTELTMSAINHYCMNNVPVKKREKKLLTLPPEEFLEAISELAIKGIKCYLNIEDYLGSISSEKKAEYYRYIPFCSRIFVETLVKVLMGCSSKNPIKSFLDVGAGYGDKVYIAHKLGLHSRGIEYMDDYVAGAKKFGVSGVIKADAFNFHQYHKFDLIYLYHPIRDDDLYYSLVETIMKRMKSGTYFLEVCPHGSPISRAADIHGVKIIEHRDIFLGQKL